MKKVILTLVIALATNFYMQAQTVKGVPIEADIIEVWAFKKPFSSKDVYFVNYGQKKFRPSYYNHKSQAISDNEGNEFEKGEWLKLYSFLKEQGWTKLEERLETIGNIEGRATTFERNK